MRENLADFLADMAADPDKRASFGTDPGDQMAGAGLTPAEQSAVTSRDSSAVASALGEAGLAAGDVSNDIMPMRAPARKAPKRKAPAKKAPKRKAPAKKAPKRKAPAKTTRKAAKKSSRKTARKATRKSTSKKPGSRKR